MNLTANTVNQISKHHPRSVNFFQYTSRYRSLRIEPKNLTDRREMFPVGKRTVSRIEAISFLLETFCPQVSGFFGGRWRRIYRAHFQKHTLHFCVQERGAGTLSHGKTKKDLLLFLFLLPYFFSNFDYHEPARLSALFS